MPKADLNGQESSEALEAASKPFSVEDESALRDSLKRCSPATIEAAIAYRKTNEASHLPAVIIGVIERFVEPDLRSKLKAADDELRLVEDLGVDSLTMMEIVILVEDVLQMQINNEDLRNLRTVGDLPRQPSSSRSNRSSRSCRSSHRFFFSTKRRLRAMVPKENTRSPARSSFFRATSRTTR